MYNSFISLNFKLADKKMTNTINSKNTSNIFRRPRKGKSRTPHNLGPIAKPTSFQNAWTDRKELPNEGELKKILFLSKRGMSRSPIAREVMRSVLEKTDFSGKVVVFSAGVTKAYDECSIDKRMQEFCKLLGYHLQANSSFANPSILARADLVITLDHESEEFTRVQKQAIRGEVRPLGVFMAPGCEPYAPDPFERDDELSVDECYDKIVSCIEYGCTKLSSALPSLIS
jgi:protein-tyrosine-phosphatase